VRAKLAQLIASNPALACTAAQSDAIGAAAEGAVHRPAIQKQPYTSAATALAAAVRRAPGWHALAPWAGAFAGCGREAFLEAAVAAAEAAAGGGQDEGDGRLQRAVQELRMLRDLEVTAGLLQATGAGRRVRALKKCAGGVGEAAGAVVDAWRARVAAATAAVSGEGGGQQRRERPPAGSGGGG
jgi:hypothetical protein